VNKSVLVGMISVAGLASSLNAQGLPSPTAQGSVIELRIVVDGTAGAPASTSVDYNPATLGTVPAGWQPYWVTAVGLTVQARVLRPATVPDSLGGTNPPVAVQNYGISAFSNGSISGTAPQLSSISMTDSLGGGQLQRGRTPGATNLPSNSLYGTFNPFRGLFSPTGEQNTATGSNRATGNANGAALPATLTRNGFIDMDSNGNQRIRGMDLGYGQGATGRTTQLPTLSNDPNATDNWQNLYRLIYIPQAVVGGAARDITIDVSGVLRFFLYFTVAAGNDGELGTPDDTYTYFGLSENSARTASVTFTVPTPGAAAILGLGGLVAARRRRA
jgi:hypothetical protein